MDRQFVGIQQNSHRSIVHQAHLHICAKFPGLCFHTFFPYLIHKVLIQRFRYIRSRRSRKRRPCALAAIGANVKLETTSMLPPTSRSERFILPFSSLKIRIWHSLLAMVALCFSVSPGMTPDKSQVPAQSSESLFR